MSGRMAGLSPGRQSGRGEADRTTSGGPSRSLRLPSLWLAFFRSSKAPTLANAVPSHDDSDGATNRAGGLQGRRQGSLPARCWQALRLELRDHLVVDVYSGPHLGETLRWSSLERFDFGGDWYGLRPRVRPRVALSSARDFSLVRAGFTAEAPVGSVGADRRILQLLPHLAMAIGPRSASMGQPMAPPSHGGSRLARGTAAPRDERGPGRPPFAGPAPKQGACFPHGSHGRIKVRSPIRHLPLSEPGMPDVR